MVATVLLSMMILTILSTLIGAYRVAAKARYNDHARYIVKSMADQFLTMQPTSDPSGNPYPIFSQMANTGYGLTWTNADGTVATGGTNPGSAPASIPVILGDNTGASVTAQVSRSVWLLVVTPNSGSLGDTTITSYNASAGTMLRGDFTITYNYPPGNATANQRTLTQTISVVRAIP